MFKTEFMPTPANWKTLKVSKYAQLIEYGEGIDIEGLTNHIAQYGFDPDESIILIWNPATKEWEIFDGRHKREASIKAGKTPTFKKFIGNKDDIAAYIAKKFFRQHIATNRLAMYYSKFSKNFEISRNIAAFHGTVAERAEKAGVSERTMRDADKISEHGTEELQDAVADGQVTIADAAKIATAPLAIQKKAVKRKRSGKARTVSAAAAVLQSDADETRKDLKDEEGHDVPDECLEDFATLEMFKAADKWVKEGEALIDELARLPGAEQFQFTLEISGDANKRTFKSKELSVLKRELRFTRPHVICTDCKGKRKKDAKKCSKCSGSGWLSKRSIDAPKEKSK